MSGEQVIVILLKKAVPIYFNVRQMQCRFVETELDLEGKPTKTQWDRVNILFII